MQGPGDAGFYVRRVQALRPPFPALLSPACLPPVRSTRPALPTSAPPRPAPPCPAAGERRKAEEKLVVVALPAVPTHLDKLDLRAHRDPECLRQQYKVCACV